MHPCGFRSIMPYSQGRDGASDIAHFKGSASFGLERKTGVYPFRTSKYKSATYATTELSVPTAASTLILIVPGAGKDQEICLLEW